MIKKSLLCIANMIFLFSCSRDECPAPPVVEVPSPTEEIGYYGLLSSVALPNSIIEEFNWDPALSLEIGYDFTPKVSGKMTAIEVKLPFVHGATDVHIWDSSTRTLLRTETINMALAHTIIKKNISAVNLVANKKYIISVETNYWYRYRKADASRVNFPYTSGNITYNYPATNARDICPEKNIIEYVFEGDVAFTFLRN